MALLKAEADKLSNNQMVAGVIDEIIDRDDMFAVLPFSRVNSKAYVYHRESEIAENNISTGAGLPTFIDPASADTVVEGAVPFVEITTRLRVLAGDVDVDKFVQETESDSNDQLAIQIAKKAKAVGRQYHSKLATGDSGSAPKEFDGIKVLSTAGQSIVADTGGVTTNGGPLSLAQLDRLLDLVPLGADALVMRRGTVRAFRALVRAAGGNDAGMLMMPAFGKPMLTHNGVPILANDFLSGAETTGSLTTGCSVYAARFNEADGLHGLYGGDSAGIRVESVGTVQNKDADRIRVKWYCGLALKSTKSLARLSGVSNS
jgi:hypothetical protein